VEARAVEKIRGMPFGDQEDVAELGVLLTDQSLAPAR